MGGDSPICVLIGISGKKMDSPSDDDDHNDDFVLVERDTAEDAGEAKAETRDGPPLDDCCPICFGSFSVPCRSDCGHWYCASCILQYWNYSSAPKKCKCPMCSHHINMLVPEASLCHLLDEEVSKVLENVRRYNNLFVGGVRGVVQKVCGLPLFIKRVFREMMDPDRPNSYVHEMRLFAMLLSILYTASPFDFIPTGGVGIVRLFDYGAIVLIIVLRLVGIYRRRRLTQRVRHLAAVEQ